jgi:hypothetical protein
LEVDVQQGNFKILQLLPQVLVHFWVEKWILPNRSETAEIGKKIEGILVLKSICFNIHKIHPYNLTLKTLFYILVVKCIYL